MLTIAAPPSKSFSHRMLMGAALASGVSYVRHVLMSKDIERTIAILSAAGAVFRPLSSGGEADFEVIGCGGVPRGADVGHPPLSCDVHESGTTCRLLTAILAAGRGRFRIHGAPRMHERPIGQLVAVLRSLGVRVVFEERPQCPPLLLDTQGLEGGAVEVPLDESSQYLSGLLLAAPLARRGLILSLGGSGVVSWPYVGLTLRTMEDFGVPFSVETREAISDGAGEYVTDWTATDWRSLTQIRPGFLRFVAPPSAYQAGEYTVEGDWSGASYFLAAGAVGRRALRVSGLRPDSLQGDRALLGILRRMGARVETDAAGVTVRPSTLRGVRLDMGACPDLVPTVAALAAFAAGETTIVNVGHLRIKESDRIAAPAAELRKAGIVVHEHADGLTVEGAADKGGPHVPQGTVFQAHGDHRIAMSAALLGLAGDKPGVIAVDDPAVVSKSFPHFWDLWREVAGA